MAVCLTKHGVVDCGRFPDQIFGHERELGVIHFSEDLLEIQPTNKICHIFPCNKGIEWYRHGAMFTITLAVAKDMGSFSRDEG